MMQQTPQSANFMTYLVVLVLLGLMILRNSRARTLRIERLWIAPMMILAATLLSFSQNGAPGPVMLAVDVVAFAAGAAFGWWRGRLTHIAVDPGTRALTSRTSPVGMLLLLALFAVRQGLRMWALQNAASLHVSVIEIGDAFLLVAVGMICVQRLEISLRAARLLAGARTDRRLT